MDKGSWLFYGLIALSGIVSLVQKAQKKAEKAKEQNQDSKPGKQPGGTFDTWIKTIVAQSSPLEELNETEEDDDFIPRNSTSESMQPKPLVKNASDREEKAKTTPIYKNAEDFRRNNESLENLSTVEGYSDQSRSKFVPTGQQPYSIKECPSEGLNPSVDLMDDEEIKRAIIYGEIFRTKF